MLRDVIIKNTRYSFCKTLFNFLYHYLYKRRNHNYYNLTACSNLYRTRSGFILHVTVFLLCVSNLQYECTVCSLKLESIALNTDNPDCHILVSILCNPEVQAKTFTCFHFISGYFTVPTYRDLMLYKTYNISAMPYS